MKKALFFLILFTVIFGSAVYAQTPKVDITFAFTRLSGFSTNQYAIWIEDSNGKLVKTLYATKFTATGGYAKRPESIPTWVQKSGLKSLSKNEVDALTGATPRTGNQSYSWDGKDKNGNVSPPGVYRIFLEATVRAENRVLYSASFTLGTAAELEPAPEYTGTDTKDRHMIDKVKIRVR